MSRMEGRRSLGNPIVSLCFRLTNRRSAASALTEKVHRGGTDSQPRCGASETASASDSSGFAACQAAACFVYQLVIIRQA